MTPFAGSAIFTGTGEYAVPSLRSLSDIIAVSAVVTNTKDNPIAIAASDLGIQIFCPKEIQDIENDIQKLVPTVMIVGHYGQIIPKKILDIPSLGSLNIHPSLLPRHRGPAPVPNTILARDTITGTTIIRMDAKMDHGPILAQREVGLDGTEYADELLKKLWDISADLLHQTLPTYLQGKIEPRAQDETRATTHGFLHRDDGKIESAMTAEEAFRKHRAYRPWPGTWMSATRKGSIIRIKFIDMEIVDSLPPLGMKSGTFFWRAEQLRLCLASGVLHIKKLKVEGGREVTGEEFYHGYRDLVTVVK